jgi:hypothetical protein
VRAEPEDEKAAGAAARGYLRASHADREQVIGTLKAAFAQGRLAKEDFMALAFLAAEIVASRLKTRSLRGQLPPGPAPGCR